MSSLLLPAHPRRLSSGLALGITAILVTMGMLPAAEAINRIRTELQLDGLDAAAKGLAIATAVDRRENGFKDSIVTLTMELRNRHGQTSTRRMTTRTLEVSGDGDKTLIQFHTPRDVAGTALLSFTHPVGDDDQWLYLPAIKRVKRIASRNKSGPFVGSEFAYEDLTSQEIPKYTYTFLRNDEIDGEAVWVVAYDPVDPNSGYSVQESWISKDHLRLEKVDFKDRKGAPLKSLRWSDYKLYQERYWRAHTMTMVNHQKGASTVLRWDDYRFATGLKDGDFSQAALRRRR